MRKTGLALAQLAGLLTLFALMASIGPLLDGCVGQRAPLPEPRWVQNLDDEYDEGHWECPEGFHVPQVKWAGWTCQPGGEGREP